MYTGIFVVGRAVRSHDGVASSFFSKASLR